MMCNLNCALCTKPLSVSPVKLYEEKFICGRCVCEKGDTMTAFESLAKSSEFLFPCQYEDKGCKARLRFGEARNHEEKCERKLIKCPMENCFSQVFFCDIKSHVEEFHTDSYSNLSFKGRFLNNNNNNDTFQRILQHNNDLFLFSLQNTNYNKQTRINLNYLNDNFARKCGKYKATFRSKDFEKEFSLRVNEIKFCGDATSSVTIPQTMLEFVSITDAISSEFLVEISFGDGFLPEPKTTSIGDSCKTCTSPKTKCVPIGVAEHQTENKIYSSLDYCYVRCNNVRRNEYSEIGESRLKNSTVCPVEIEEDCGEKLPYEKIYNHCTRAHNCLSTPLKKVQINLTNNNTNKPTVRLIKAHGKIFKLYRTYRDNCMKFTIMCVGVEEDAERYEFNLEIIADHKTTSLKYTGDVKPFRNNNNIENECCLNLQKGEFSDYLVNGRLFCNLSIDVKNVYKIISY